MSPRDVTSPVLIVDDDERERSLLAAMVSALGYGVETAVDGEDALVKLDTAPISAIITDLMMPKLDGYELLRNLGERNNAPPAIVLTGFGSIDKAVEVVHKLQAFWFLEKPAQSPVLASLLDRAIQYGNLFKEAERLHRQLSSQGLLGDLVGSSAAMQQVYALIQRVAPTQASVLITGENGTGKEMVARTIHRLSPRAARPFVAINCAALPEHLIESELFGHEKGAFTGAHTQHAGCFEQADGGTLLLDEIGEMPLAMQVRLLRTLEESTVRRLGGSREIQVNVRVIAATNRSIESAVEDKVLRKDLYYRLNVFRIHLPPLRERLEDIPAITQTMIGYLNGKHECEVTGIDQGALEKLMSHNWPGNVRELRNTLEWAVITAQKKTITLRHLPKGLSQRAVVPAARETSEFQFEMGRSLQELEREYIIETLKSTNGNRKETARLLGISLRTLYNRIAALSIRATEEGPGMQWVAGRGSGS